MKKFTIISIIFILIGFIVGINVFDRNMNTKYYFIEEGIYTEKSDLKKNITSIREKVIDKEKNNYHVYLGITKNEIIAEKIKNIYKKRNINTRIVEKYIPNDDFSNNVNQFDLLIKDSISDEQIITIEEVILANYEEIIKNNSEK